jgi:hypothetical protein
VGFLARFVSNAGSGSGIVRLRRKIPLLFGEKSLKTVCFRIMYFVKKASPSGKLARGSLEPKGR